MLNKYNRQSTRHKSVIYALTEKKKKKKKEIYFLSVGAAFQLLRKKHSQISENSHNYRFR